MSIYKSGVHEAADKHAKFYAFLRERETLDAEDAMWDGERLKQDPVLTPQQFRLLVSRYKIEAGKYPQTSGAYSKLAYIKSRLTGFSEAFCLAAAEHALVKEARSKKQIQESK